MIQREVTDHENTRWICIQAYTGLHEKASEKATQLAESEDDKVTVVCTPSGGSQTVRLNLNSNWNDELTDDALIEAIEKSRN